MLEIAERTVGPHMVAQGRTAGFDRLADDGADRRRQSFGRLRIGEHRGRPARIEPGAPQRLADVYIAEAGDDGLLQALTKHFG